MGQTEANDGPATTSSQRAAKDWSDAEVVGRHVARARRVADLSQRALADAVGLTPAAIGHIERGANLPSLPVLARILATAGLRLAVVDEVGTEVSPIRADGLRDAAGRRFPAHVDISPVDEVPRWARRGERSAHQRPLVAGLRGPEREARRRRRGETPTASDHPSRVEVERRAALARRFPRVLVVPPPPPSVECTCRDECFETTCVDTCTCRCE